MSPEERIAALEKLLRDFWGEAAVSGLAGEMSKRKAFLDLDARMRELGLLPRVKS